MFNPNPSSTVGSASRRPLARFAVLAGLVGLAGLACVGWRTPFVGGYGLCEAGRYRLLIAATPEQREMGLMHVRTIPREKGMLFPMPETAPARVLIKNNKQPAADLVFIGQKGDVQMVTPIRPNEWGMTPSMVYTASGAFPGDEPPPWIQPAPPSSFVVQLAPGEGIPFSLAWKPEMLAALRKPVRTAFGF